jgi:hypothetical protein
MLDVLVVDDWISGNRSSFRRRGAVVCDSNNVEFSKKESLLPLCFIISRCRISFTGKQAMSSRPASEFEPVSRR